MSFTGNNNRVDSWSYDANGNLLNDQVHLYQYDAENRLTQVDSGATASYIYNAEGARVHENVGGTVEEFLNGSGPQSLTIVAGSQNLFEADYSFGGRPLATANSGGLSFAATDTLGTVRARLNASGAIVESDTSWPYGEFHNYTNAISRLHFTGKLDDTESGLDYFGARYYASQLGRFMTPDWSEDPEAIPYADLTDPQMLNLYTFARNNPVSQIDPDGHDFNLVCAGTSDTCQGGLQGSTTYTMDADGNTTSSFTATLISSGKDGLVDNMNNHYSASVNGSGVFFSTDGGETSSAGIFTGHNATSFQDAGFANGGALTQFKFTFQNSKSEANQTAAASFTFGGTSAQASAALQSAGFLQRRGTEGGIEFRSPGTSIMGANSGHFILDSGYGPPAGHMHFGEHNPCSPLGWLRHLYEIIP